MSAAELRQAAETLRGRAEAATPGKWLAYGHGIGVTVQGCTCAGTAPGYPQHESYCGTDGPIVDGAEPDVAYIATVHPGVGLALADLFVEIASVLDVGSNPNVPIVQRTLDIARLINGGA